MFTHPYAHIQENKNISRTKDILFFHKHTQENRDISQTKNFSLLFVNMKKKTFCSV